MDNDTETLTLTDFLLARIAERDLFWEVVGEAKQAHPERVSRYRAESDAMRRIVEWHRPATEGPFEQETCACEYDDWSNDNPPYPCPTLRYLAAIHADHPDYREEWRP